MKKRSQTLSKWYYDDEIIAKEADGTIHLKEGVRRVMIWPQLKDMSFGRLIQDENPLEHSDHINEYRILQDKIDLIRQIEDEEKDFDN